MKKIILVLALAFMAHISFAQRGEGKKPSLSETDIPSVVMTAFKAKYASTDKAKWNMTKKGQYKASFKSAEGKTAAVYNPDGTWLHTRTKLEAVPAEVSSYVTANYAGYETKKVVLHENGQKGTQYLAHLEKGEEKMKLIFDQNKAFVKVAGDKAKGKGKGKGKGKEKSTDGDDSDDDEDEDGGR